MPELTRRYIVMQMAAEAPFDLSDPDAPFVLKPWKDPAALEALRAYRDHCYDELARELDLWITAIRSGSAPLGGVGRRNAEAVVARPRPRPKAKARARRTGAARSKRKKKATRRS